MWSPYLRKNYTVMSFNRFEADPSPDQQH